MTLDCTNSRIDPILTFNKLRIANILRLPQFLNRKGYPAHSQPDGSDWTPAQWLQAMVGEVGEYANFRKKFERGDITFEQFEKEAERELADIQTYLDLLAMRCLDTVERLGVEGEDALNVWVHVAHPTGVDLAKATRDKFNEVSDRVGCKVKL